MPITSADADRFNRKDLSRRIAERLMQPHPPAQALLGNLGAGKTSIYYLVQEELRRRNARNIRLLRINLWPYETPRAAVEGIIGDIVSALTSEVNTISLRGLPAEYGEAVAKSGIVASDVLSRLITRRPNALEALSHIDEIAIGVGLQFVLWVEDLERFAAGSARGGVDDTKEAERLAPIRSLLHALDLLRSVTIVTVTTDLFHRFDLEKISRYIERIPLLRLDEVVRIVAAFRDSWRQLFSDLDPEPLAARLEGWSQKLDPMWAAFFERDTVTSLSKAVGSLCRSPRRLKHVLRRCEEAWSLLHGEVDVDELLAASVLRVASPDGFAILDAMVPRFRRREVRRTEEGDPFLDFDSQINLLNIDAVEQNAIKYIARYLFEKNSRMQSVAKAHHTDYWKRIVEQNPLRPDDLDQNVLQVLLEDDYTKILSLLSAPHTGSAVIDLSDVLSIDRIMALILKSVISASPERPSNLSQRDTRLAPGFVELWAILLQKAEKEDIDSSLLPVLKKCAELTVLGNLNLFCELDSSYASVWGSEVRQSWPLTRMSLDSAKASLRTVFANTYLGRPSLLVSGLRSTPEGIIRQILFGHEQLQAADPGIMFQQWNEFMPTLLEALRMDPDVVLPRVAPLISSLNRLNVAKFEPDQCVRVFGSLEALLSSVPSHLKSECNLGSRSHALVVAAQEHLAQPRFFSVLQGRIASLDDRDPPSLT